MREFKIRCSQISEIMGQKGLGKTGETFLKSWLKSQIYEKKKEINSKYLTKGILEEENNIEFMSHIFRTTLSKNEQFFENDFLIGTPDIITPKYIIDIKSSFDCFTFPLFEKELNPDYYLQMQGYMELTGKRNAQVIYVLGNTPVNIIEKEARILANSMGYTYEDALDMTINRFDYSLVPDHLRYVIFDVEYNQEVIEKIKSRVEESRNYINSLKW